MILKFNALSKLVSFLIQNHFVLFINPKFICCYTILSIKNIHLCAIYLCRKIKKKKKWDGNSVLFSSLLFGSLTIFHSLCNYVKAKSKILKMAFSLCRKQMINKRLCYRDKTLLLPRYVIHIKKQRN